MLATWLLTSALTLPLAHDAALVAARDLVTVDRGALGLGEQESLRDLEVFPLAHGAVVKAKRSYRGVPVEGEAVAIRLDEQGRVMRVRSDFSPLAITGRVLVSPREAFARAASSVWGLAFVLPRTDAPAQNATLVVDAESQAYAYRVVVPGLVPQQTRIVLVDAETGAILSTRSPIRHAANDAAVYEPAPAVADTLAAPDATVGLENLYDGVGGTLEGTYVDSFTCDKDEEALRIATCRTLLGNDLCGFQASLDKLVGIFCGASHRVVADSEAGYVAAPADDVDDYTGAEFNDTFAEPHAYYHVDEMTKFFRALGHSPLEAIHVLSNIAVPSGELIACASETYGDLPNADKTVANARSIVGDCALAYEFVAFDNAFYLHDDAGSMTDLPSIIGVPGGIYVGQGSAADLAYDGTVLHHELGHALAARLDALQQGQTLDDAGVNDTVPALNEGIADYFAAARNETPLVGPYMAGRLGLGDSLRDLSVEVTCPEYWSGEAHLDSIGFSSALWEARDLYPQTEEELSTGLTVRVFDRAVYEALAMLTNDVTLTSAVEEVVAAVAAEPLLDDDTGALAAGVFAARNLDDCGRARSFALDTPIPSLYLMSKGASDALSNFLGSPKFSPFAPGPVQLVIDLGEGETRLACADFSAEIASTAISLEDMPDFFGTGGGEPTWDVRLVANPDAPVAFEYSEAASNITVTIAAGGEAQGLEVAQDGSKTFVRGRLEFPSDAAQMYYALGNATPASVHLVNVTLTAADCSDNDGGGDGNGKSGGKDGGCNASNGAMPAFGALLALVLLTRKGRRA